MRRQAAAALTAALFSLAGCGLAALCTPGDRRCNASGTIEECTAHPAGFSGPADDPSHHDSSPNSWEPAGACGSASLCKTEPSKTSKGVAVTNAFCVLAADPDPRCSGDPSGFFCQDTVALGCEAGFAIHEELCRTCDRTAIPDPCLGGVDSSCSADSDCATGLTCRNTACELACTCANGTRCTACDELERQTVGPTQPAPFTWICSAGFCARQF